MKEVQETATTVATQTSIGTRSEQNPSVVLPRIVIVGAGFGGLKAALALHRANARITVIDRQNHHLFQPLLYWVATAGLSPADISSPIRSILRKQMNTEVLMGEVTGVDSTQQRVLMGDQAVPFDYLVLATGAHDNYFGHPEWEHYAPGLKSIVDATSIRRKILLAFEAAEREPDPQKVKSLLTFVLVGAGPTGVEMSARSRNWRTRPWPPISGISTPGQRASFWWRPRRESWPLFQSRWRAKQNAGLSAWA